MGLDWERVAGQGGAYLVEWATAVQQGGRLSPIGLQLVVKEVERVKFILTEEIARLQPEGDLTEAAIAALRTHYQTRLDAAEHIIAAAHRAEVSETAPSLTTPSGEGTEPSLITPSGGGTDTEPSLITPSGEGTETEPSLPTPIAGGTEPSLPTPHPDLPPQGGRETSPRGREESSVPSLTLPRRGREGLREFFADRSILMLSYVGAFLLIVATLLFELSAFTAVDSRARFAGVLILNLVFGIAGWICFRLPAMRLVGRTYVAIAALMVPLTFIAAWVFLVLAQYGLSRDLAVAIAGTSCALLYGALAVRLESRGYALLSLVAMAIAWGAGIDLVGAGRWRGALLVPMVAAYLVMGHGFVGFKTFHAAFARFADVAVHVAAIGVVGWTFAFVAGADQVDWTVVTVNAAELAVVYIAYAVLSRSALGGLVAMALFGATWVAALHLVDLEPLTGLLLTPLIAVYILATYRSRRIRSVDVVFATYGEPFIHLATVVVLGWTVYSAGTVLDGSLSQAWVLGAATLAVVAFLYVWYATLSAKRYGGLAAMVALGLAWLCLLNGIDIWPWRGLAFTPVMAFYIVVASRRPVIRDLFASEPEGLITGAAGIAAAWAIFATATSADLSIGSVWYPTAATLAVIALLYSLDAKLRGDGLAPALSLGALVGAWIAGINALELGDWSELAVTPLVGLFSLVAFRGDRLGSVGAAFARSAEPFVHGVALIAIGWSAYPALVQITQGAAVSGQAFSHLASTFGALTVAYALYSWLSRRRSMQWTVAIGVTLTTITLNQALALPASASALALPASALAIEFLVLAIGKAIVARFYRSTRMHTFFYVTAAVQAVIAAAIPVEQEGLRATILIVAAAMGVFMAVDGKRPEWLYLAGAFFTYGWYWLLKVVIPPPPNPGPSTLVLIFSPLPVVFTAIAVALHRVVADRRWRLPLYAWAGAVALAVVYLGAESQDTTILGFALLAYAAGIYVTTALEQVPYGVPAASISAVTGVFSLLMAASAAPQWYPLTFTLVAWVIYSAAFLWKSKPRETWSRMHCYSGLGLMVLTVAGCFASPDFAMSGSAGAFAALAATWALALMLAVDASAHATAAFDYIALITAALGSYWIAHYLGASNPQWYVTAPGLALVAGGIMLFNADRRFVTPKSSMANAMIGIGTAVLLGTTAIQTLDPALSVSLYAGILLCEAIAALLVGIATRSRALVLAGAAGAALASLRALVILIQEVPLFIVFGLVAILLLGGAAALAVLRARFADARLAMTRSWRDWS